MHRETKVKTPCFCYILLVELYRFEWSESKWRGLTFSDNLEKVSVNIWIERCLFRCRIGQIEDDLTKRLPKKAWHLGHKGVTLFFGRRLVRSSPIWPKLHRKWHLSIRYSNLYTLKSVTSKVLTKTGWFNLLFPVHEFLRIWNPTVGVGGQPPPFWKYRYSALKSNVSNSHGFLARFL